MDLKDLVGMDLAKAEWRIELWYERGSGPDGYGDSYRPIAYYKNESLARAKVSSDCDGSVREVYVLTNDGKTGYIFGGKEVQIEDEEALRVELVEKAKNKLTQEDRVLLGIA